MKKIFLTFLVLLVMGCNREISRPFNHAIGTLNIEGQDFYTALIVKHMPDGVHAIGGFVSDAPLENITIGIVNSQKANLQIIPTQGIIVYNGKKSTIDQDGRLIWIIDSKSYEQSLDGFPLETKLTKPKDIPNKP